MVLDFKLRRLITRFRISNHVLEIEKGGYVKPKVPLEQRLCKVCSLDAIDDEYYFLCVCPSYQDYIRNFTYNKKIWVFSSNNFTGVLNCSELSCFYLEKTLLSIFHTILAEMSKRHNMYMLCLEPTQNLVIELVQQRFSLWPFLKNLYSPPLSCFTAGIFISNMDDHKKKELPSMNTYHDILSP